VVTDFSRDLPATVPESLQIDAALREMIQVGVRALLVARGDDIVGLITAHDIQGDRAGRFLQNPSCDHHPCRRQDTHVGDIMTPWDQLDTLDWGDLQSATVGDLIAIFQTSEATHIIVLEWLANSSAVVRGLVSRTRLERQLNNTLHAAAGPGGFNS